MLGSLNAWIKKSLIKSQKYKMENNPYLIHEIITRTNGLEYFSDEYYPQELQSAWASIVPMTAKVYEKVESNHQDFWDELVKKWTYLCQYWKIVDETGQVLISVGGFAGAGTWQKIGLNDCSLLLTISIYEKQPELIVMNLDRNVFIAISCEENEFCLFVAKKISNQWSLLEK
jgi:hypothetical protein